MALGVADDAESPRVRDRFGSVACVELAQDCRDVVLDCALREKQPLRDSRVAEALVEELQNLKLAGGERSRVVARRRPRPARNVSRAGRSQRRVLRRQTPPVRLRRARVRQELWDGSALNRRTRSAS